jgi:hypothetical protein
VTHEVVERTAAMSVFLAAARFLGIDTTKLLRNLPHNAPYSLPPPFPKDRQLVRSALETATAAFGIEKNAMSADIMPCGCEGHADNTDLCNFPKLVLYASHAPMCSRGLPSALRPCNCGLLDLITDEYGRKLSSLPREQEKRKKHPHFAPWDQNAPKPETGD